MSCNGCRVLRKGCSDTCILRPCLQWIQTPEAQGHATVFVAKFFGRAGLMSFISAVPETQRPALFQSLLVEAAGRTVNPVNGAVGLLWTGNWHVCQVAVQTILGGGALSPVPEFLRTNSTSLDLDEAFECTGMIKPRDPNSNSRSRVQKRRRPYELQLADLDLSLTSGFPAKVSPETPSRNSEESVTTTCFESGFGDRYNDAIGGRRAGEPKLLNLF